MPSYGVIFPVFDLFEVVRQELLGRGKFRDMFIGNSKAFFKKELQIWLLRETAKMLGVSSTDINQLLDICLFQDREEILGGAFAESDCE